ncbi:hypothetical protein IWX85_003743 [Polaromonas sp. CG_9.11]|nr:hypothetical protein [Polaromonas sp. CG_9.11]
MKKVSRTAPAAPDAESALYASIHALVLSARNTVARGVERVAGAYQLRDRPAHC